MKIRSILIHAVLLTAFARLSPGAEVVGCEEASISPSVYTFYGTRDTITQKIGDEKINLSARRVFVQTTQGEDWAEVKLFEKKKGGNYEVSRWRGKSINDLYAKLNAVIIANKGVNCVGEQVKAALKESFAEMKVSEDVTAPASGLAAFAHSIKDGKGDFLMTAIYILC